MTNDATAQAVLSAPSAAAAFDEFERAARVLFQQNPEVRFSLLAGVDIPPAVEGAYAHGGAPFSARRLDILRTVNGPMVAESNDEFGGLAAAYLIDRLHGINQGYWDRAWRWLTAKKKEKLVFLTSHSGGPVYRGVKCLVSDLREQGYDVDFLPTSDLSRLTIQQEQVLLDGQKVGTIFRLFSILEVTEGKLISLVKAAQYGVVRMVPEFASWGDRTWFSLWGDYAEFFQHEMSEGAFAQLSKMMPQTVLVRGNQLSRPLVLADGSSVSSVMELKNFTAGQRCQVILKGAGVSALSRQVIVGSNIKSGRRWRELLDNWRQPFIIQACASSEELALPAAYFVSGAPEEQAACRVLLRTWSFGGVCVGATVASPRSSLTYGPAALLPVELR